MKRVKITFVDEWEVDEDFDMEYVYSVFLDYLHECVNREDVTAFEFTEINKENT